MDTAPSYASEAYWDGRFREERQAFEWLQDMSCLDEAIQSSLALRSDIEPQILHIGSGTSMLSFNLRDFVGKASQIHNVDFSIEAVRWGQSKEAELLNITAGEEENQKEQMRWSRVSLLSLSSVLSSFRPGEISLVVDKSTSDAIACNSDIEVPFPFPLYVPSEVSLASKTKTDLVHPAHILALHLAVITIPGARWIALSYSSERFPFFPNSYGVLHEPIPDGLPDPARFWTLIKRQEIQTNQTLGNSEDKVVYRPTISHYLYILERTSLKLNGPDMPNGYVF